MWVETFTGLRLDQFGRLLKVVRERGGNGTLRGRPWSLPLAERVLVVAVYYRTNLTMRQLAPLFGISSSTVCRVIQRLGPLLALEPVSRPTDGADRLWIVDGTLIPVRDRHLGTSSRNYRFSANVQVIVDADTRLVIAAARPVPGTTADAHAWRNSGLAEHCAGVTVLGDGAYLNCGMVVPHRKRPRRPLLPGEEDDNAAHRKVRARVEHVIGRMKNYKILRDCRQHGNGLHHAVQAIAQMHNLALAS
ncbi:transposase family protein [Streptomyces sp. NPDC102467]|uniref:transposase family protein n=1 Tax=Streptomyces sp. NPDC102467 TaxID=3366179 RepID=UPI00382038AD